MQKSCLHQSTENRDIVHLPKPASGEGFNKIEIVNIMLNVPSDNCSLWHAMIQEISDHQKQNNTPCCSRTIYCLLESMQKVVSAYWESARDHKYAVMMILRKKLNHGSWNLGKHITYWISSLCCRRSKLPIWKKQVLKTSLRGAYVNILSITMLQCWPMKVPLQYLNCTLPLRQS
jgi:hypothetical protein